MSVEASKNVEETAPVEAKPVEQPTTTPTVATEAPAVTEAPKTESTEAPAAVDGTATSAAAEETKPAEETLKKDETVVDVVPASEGTLGYKAPGFLKQFHFSKHFFWFSEEPLSADALNTYSRSEKSSVAQNAAWARETGKGLFFFSKRAEDKAHPAGVIPLYEAVGIAKDGMTSFSFDTVHGKSHKFEASTAAERDSWVVALEKQKDEGKALKEELTGRESYKKNLEEYSKPTAAAAVPAAVASRSKSKEAKKSLDANTATAAATTAPVATTEAKKEESPDAATTTPVAPVEEKKDTAKERSQSRKRASVFGSFMKKDEAKEEKKAAEKAEKQEKQEEKKVEAEVKKEEAKEDHDASKAAEAVAAAAVAAAPAAVISTDKKEEKVEPTTEMPAAETPATEAAATTPTTEKKGKRGSVFGSLFGKAKVTSPTTEKTEKDVGPTPPAKDDVPPVSETAPKIDEPIDTKPLDAAAVTAPANTDGASETPKEASAVRPVATEKKSFLGFMNKKPEAKKEEAEVKPVEPTAATGTPAEAASAPVTDAAAKSDSETPAEEKKASADKEKRRTSLFGGLSGTIKKKKDETEPTENGTDRKREKSPLPTKIGGLFRKPSKAVKPEETKPATEAKDEVKTETPATAAATEPIDTTTTEAKTDIPASTDVPDSKIVGDVVPEALTTQDKIATAPEVKASA